MINNCVAFSDNDDKEKAFFEVKEKINELGKPVLIIFSAPVEGFHFFAQKFSLIYKETTVLGTTTSVAFCTEGYSENGLAALAVFDGIECVSGVVEEITRYPLRHAGVIEEAVKKLGITENTICIEYSTAFGKCEELVQDTYRSVLEHKKVQVAGGTAGAPLMTSQTFVSLNGTVYEEASVFVLIKSLNGRIITYKENIFKPTGKYIVATDVDCDERMVYEFDGKKASDVMSFLLDMPKEEINNNIYLHPLGRIVGNDIYITDAERTYPDGSISYYARIYNHTKLALLEFDDLDKVWNETAANIKYEIENPSMSIMINCYGRQTYFNRIGRVDDFCNKLKTEYGNYIGSSGFGEQINYEHFNETMVMVVFE